MIISREGEGALALDHRLSALPLFRHASHDTFSPLRREKGRALPFSLRSGEKVDGEAGRMRGGADL
jgi:hypothetical protein